VTLLLNSLSIPQSFIDAAAALDPSWRATALHGLEAVDRATPGYLQALDKDEYLPTQGRIFAAFSQPLSAIRYVLVGEGPYPRAASATGVCFMDGAVGNLWSEQADGGLSKAVNRATSLRNFIKMLLLADGQLAADDSGAAALATVARQAKAEGSNMIATLAELQTNLIAHGFLLLNASLVFRPHVAPAIDAKAWKPFIEHVLQALLVQQGETLAPTLILWGKVAASINGLPQAVHFPQVISEHPYNLSFIVNPAMHALFGPLHLLQKSR
jgi:uracil-DNA glycosylase